MIAGVDYSLNRDYGDGFGETQWGKAVWRLQVVLVGKEVKSLCTREERKTSLFRQLTSDKSLLGGMVSLLEMPAD